MKKLLIGMLCFFSFLPLIQAEEELGANSKSVMLLEASTGKVLFEKNPDEKLSPASMTKIMSMLLIMEAIDSGKIKMDDSVMISKTAADMGGSQIFIQEGETYKVEALLKGVAISSGNDAVVALAEKVSGSVSNFVKMMNEKAKVLNLQNTNFVNPHGLDAENHYSSARDMSIMGMELVKHEKILEFSSIYEDYLKRPDGSSTWLVNTNRLVRFYNGVDGLKTGFTDTAGYCITTTAKRNNMRLLSVVMGVETSDKRSSDTVNLLNYGFNSYLLHEILNQDQPLGSIKIQGGVKETVDVKILDHVTEIQKVTDEEKTYNFQLVTDKIKAPVKVGDKVGKVIIRESNGLVYKEVDVTVKEDVLKASILDLWKRNIRNITSGKI